MWTGHPGGTPQLWSHLWKSHVRSTSGRRAAVPQYPPGMTTSGDPSAPRSSPASWLLMRFATQMHAVSNRFAVRQALHPTDVTAMAILAAAGRPLTAGELATQLELSTGATTRLLDRLQRAGHVARATDPGDKRRRLVSITPSAGATAGAYFGELGTRVDEVLGRFDADEQAVIGRFLDQLVTAMEQLPEG